MQIIHTKDLEPYRKQYYAFMDKYFSNDDFRCPEDAYVDWRGPFCIAECGLEGKEVKSYLSFLITTQSEMERYFRGDIPEWELKPYPEGGREKACLLWSTLIFENKSHAPYLIKAGFKEIEQTIRAWKINISYVFACAYTPISERLMRLHHFKKVGMYEDKYPIMMIDVMDNVWLKAFIPYIKPDSTPPWPGKVDEPVPEIDREHKTQFDR